MVNETSSEDRDLFVIDIDGQKSDPITPRTPKDRERIDRLRTRYIQAGLIESESTETRAGNNPS